ncbi:MAG: phosphate ABC transporter permease subunit PstC [Candidatus Geothermarchaeales archaeon]
MRSPKRLGEKIIERLLLLSALVSTLVVAVIFIFLFRESLPAFAEISPVSFLTGGTWQPSAEEPKYGILPLISGTMLVTMGAVGVAVPLGISTALYLSEVARSREKEILKPFIELLAGVPSVVYGFVALTVLATAVQNLFGNTFRLNALNGSLVLAVMILPTIVSIAEDALSAVPTEYKEAALALGASRWETLRRVVLPAASSGVFVGVVLGLGRAVGETMAVLMATGNSPVVTGDFFRSVETMTAAIAIEMGEVVYGSIHYSALFSVGIVLFAITFVINLVADVFVERSVRRFQL